MIRVVKRGCAINVPVAALALVLTAHAQMQFSYYNGGSVSTDYSTVSTWFNVIDGSSCVHSNYSITVGINSPDGRNASVTGSGLYNSTSIPVSNVMGNYTPYTSLAYYCSCIHGMAGAGSGGNFDTSQRVHAYSAQLSAKSPSEHLSDHVIL
jgi:hypothetical protein